MTEPVDGRLGCGRLFAEEPGRIPPPMEGLEAGEVIDDLGAIDRAGGDEERLPIPPDRVVMLGRLLEVDGFGETMRLPAPLDRVVMLDRFMDGDTVLGMDRFAKLLDERVILERFDSRDLSLAVVSMVDRLADGLDVIAEALGVGTERRVCSDLFAEILEDAEGEETDGLVELSEAF